jgi:hypothetical protein
MKMFILLVLQDHSILDEVMAAWRENGAPGITVLDSKGMSHLSRQAALREDFPIMPGIDDLTETTADSNHTLFTIVNDENTADKIISATLAVTGSLDLPNTGIIATWMLSKVIGLNRCEE